MFHIPRRAKVGALGAFIVAATLVTHGYASTNSVEMEDPSTLAGYGAASVVKPTITKITYTLGSLNKGQVTAVVFEIQPTVFSTNGSARAFVQHKEAATWTSCGNVANNATVITCPVVDMATSFGKALNGDAYPMRLVVAD